MQKEEDNFALHFLQEETSNLKGNKPAESRGDDQGDQDHVQQVPPQKKQRSVASQHFLTCALQEHQHSNLLLRLSPQ